MKVDKATREHHRHEHRARAIAAMQRETTVEGRLAALLREQQQTFDASIADMRASQALPPEVLDALAEEIQVYRDETPHIVAAVVHGHFPTV
jgi:hypothetical protein